MSISFYGNELINIAIGIERRGIAFYDVMAKSTRSAAGRDVFHYLVGMEREHIQTFQNMLDEADKYEIPETYAGEYGAYLQALVDSAVFTDDMVASEMATQADSDIKALELAISAEKDSILFYYGMKEIMPKRAHPTLDKIIAEEKLHLSQLSELKKKLAE
ncbi:MAG: ferritin family protein [Dehalococcoidia bacterium]|nr:MAG: ferritin family protein [Dehalococcoidia bacterium]